MKRNKVLILVAIVVAVISISAFISGVKFESTPMPSIPQSIQSVNNKNQNSSAAMPSITLSQDKASVGSLVTVSGKGFAQSALVKITLPDNSVVDITTSPGTYLSTFGNSGRFGTEDRKSVV